VKMQASRNAAATAKEAAANTVVSARTGLEKTKATVQEKVDKISAHDPIQKDMATHKKDERIHQAEYNKQDAREHNAAARHVASTRATCDGNGNQNFTTGAGHLTGSQGNQNIAATGTGQTGAHTGGGGGITTPDYLTGSDISKTGLNPGRNTNVENPSSRPGAGLNPAREPGHADAVYPADIGRAGNGEWQDPAHNARDGGPTSAHSTGDPTSAYGTGGLTSAYGTGGLT